MQKGLTPSKKPVPMGGIYLQIFLISRTDFAAVLVTGICFGLLLFKFFVN
jgi:hypothetical protein